MANDKHNKKNKHYGQLGVAVFALALVFAVATAVLLTGGDVESSSAEKSSIFTAGGRVTSGGENLSGVSVSVNGVFNSYTNDYGIFTVRGLKTGDVLTFYANGYSFSPEPVVIGNSSFYDYKIIASTTPATFYPAPLRMRFISI